MSGPPPLPLPLPMRQGWQPQHNQHQMPPQHLHYSSFAQQHQQPPPYPYTNPSQQQLWAVYQQPHVHQPEQPQASMYGSSYPYYSNMPQQQFCQQREQQHYQNPQQAPFHVQQQSLAFQPPENQLYGQQTRLSAPSQVHRNAQRSVDRTTKESVPSESGLRNGQQPLHMHNLVQCKPCGKQFNSTDLLAKHERKHEPCPIDGCSFAADHMALHVHKMREHGSSRVKYVARELATAKEVEEYIQARRNRFPTRTRREQANKRAAGTDAGIAENGRTMKRLRSRDADADADADTVAGCVNDDDGDGPPEERSSRVPVDDERSDGLDVADLISDGEDSTSNGRKVASESDTRRACVFFLRGRCRNGAKCRSRHVSKSTLQAETASKPRQEKNSSKGHRASVRPGTEKASQKSLFEVLHEQDREEDLLRLLECMRFLVADNFACVA